MPSTRSGVYHNLKESKYTASNNEVVFFFSSLVYRQKFLEGYEEYRKTFEHRLTKAIGDRPLNISILSDIAFYESCEKRGFRALAGGSDISREELHQYALRKMMDKNNSIWYEVQAPMRWLRNTGKWWVRLNAEQTPEEEATETVENGITS